MSHRQFFVEVSTETPATTVINRIPVTNWNECLQTARELTTSMFYEDPMSQRVFHNGRYHYQGMNDLGHQVKVIPVCWVDDYYGYIDVSHECPIQVHCPQRATCRN